MNYNFVRKRLWNVVNGEWRDKRSMRIVDFFEQFTIVGLNLKVFSKNIANPLFGENLGNKTKKQKASYF